MNKNIQNVQYQRKHLAETELKFLTEQEKKTAY